MESIIDLVNEAPDDSADDSEFSTKNIDDTRYKTTHKDHPANFPPGTPRFSSTQGVCDFCHRMLLQKESKGDEDFIHYNTLLALLDSSLSCPCCSILFQSFHTKTVDIEAALQRARSNADGISSRMSFDLSIDCVAVNDGVSWVYTAVYAPSERGPINYIYGQYFYFCTSEAPISKELIWCGESSEIPLPLRKPILLEWLHDCNHSHIACKFDSTRPPTLPTRVLDIGQPDSGEPIRLITTTGLHAFYTALSHCWGKLQPLVTTLGTLHERKQGIDVYLLPKTFRNAIEVSRYLGIRYLWIDSLCIIQDDLADWEAESANMAAVYQNAYLTISATASSDGSGGLDWPFQPSMKVKYDGGKTGYFRREEYTHNTVTDSSLGRRAWVLQETVLSRRVVHFAEDQLYWACASKHASEDRLACLPKAVTESMKTKKKILGSSLVGRPYPSLTHPVANDQLKRSPKENLYQSWNDIATAYNQLEITKISDKLAALAGITSAVGNILDDTPFLGLWLENLQEDLLWIRAPRKSSSQAVRPEPLILNLPSWSWLSTKETKYSSSDIIMVKEGPLNTKLQIIRTSIRWSGQPLTSRVISSELILKGRLINMCSYDNGGLCGSPYQDDSDRGHHGKAELSGTVHMDYDINRDEEENHNLQALEVVWSRDSWSEHVSGQGGDTQGYHCHILILKSNGPGSFSRVGAGVLNFYSKLNENPFLYSEEVTIFLQ